MIKHYESESKNERNKGSTFPISRQELRSKVQKFEIVAESFCDEGAIG